MPLKAVAKFFFTIAAVICFSRLALAAPSTGGVTSSLAQPTLTTPLTTEAPVLNPSPTFDSNAPSVTAVTSDGDITTGLDSGIGLGDGSSLGGSSGSGGSGSSGGSSSSSNNTPGCDSKIMDALKSQGDLIRARDQAYARAIIRQPDPVLGLSCFDQGLKLTSILGTIFSNRTSGYTTSSLLGPAASFLGQVSFPGGSGAGLNLGRDLATVVAPIFGNMLGNFSGSFSGLFAAGGELLSGILGGFGELGNIVGSLLGGGGGGGASIGMNCTRMNDMWAGPSGAGYTVTPGTSYLGIQDLIGGVTGMAPDFTASLGLDSSLLNTAIRALTTPETGGLGSTSWPRPVAYSPESSVTAILNCINSSSAACQ